jgi:hypothetical protein
MSTCATKSYRVYERDRVVELVSRERGLSLMKAGSVEEICDEHGQTLCFLRVAKRKPAAAPLGMRGVMVGEAEVERSSTAFTRPEVQALAGRHFRHGRSLTARMTDEQRANRVSRRTGRRLPPVDLVERAVNKFDAWAKIGPALQELVREVECI